MTQRFTIFCALLISLLLAGCVTTEKGGFNDSASEEQAVLLRVALAKQNLARGDLEEARRHLKVALGMEPRSPDVHDALGLSFQYSNEQQLADEHFRQAVALGKGAARFRNNYASFLYQQERFSDARDQLEKVAEETLYEKRESALVLLGLTQQQLIDTEAAKKSFEQALVLNPKNALVLQELSIMRYDEGEFSSSWAFFQRYRQVVAQSSAKMLLLGIQLASKRGDQDSLASYALSLRNLYPDSREYRSYVKQFGA